MRVYLPATFDQLVTLHETGALPLASRYGFALSPQLEAAFAGAEDGVEYASEDIEHWAFLDAAEASLRLLATGSARYPLRRVVVSVDLPDSQCSFAPDLGDSVVELETGQVEFSKVAALHIDIADTESLVQDAVAQIDAADLGEEQAQIIVSAAQDEFLAWYDPTELRELVEEDKVL